MNCQFCNQSIQNTQSVPKDIQIYATYCQNCKVHYKIKTEHGLLKDIVFTIVEYKNCRLIHYQDNNPDCILQIGTNNFIDIPTYIMKLPLKDIYNKIDTLLPFL